MNVEQAEDVVRKAFAVLSESMRENLRWHAKAQTPIFAGRGSADTYVSRTTGFA